MDVTKKNPEVEENVGKQKYQHELIRDDARRFPSVGDWLKLRGELSGRPQAQQIHRLIHISLLFFKQIFRCSMLSYNVRSI